MIVACLLLLLAGLVSAYSTRVLPRARWVYRSPGLGLCAWYAVLAAVGSSVPAAAVVVLVGWSGTRAAVCSWWAWCVRAAGGGYGPVGRLLAAGLGAVLVVVGLRAAAAGWRVGRVLARRRGEYAAMLAAVGCQRADLGATVVDCPVPAAFVVPGRPGGVVVTTGTLQVLPAEQVAAVLAHERAHAAGRHQLLADVAGLLAAAVPTAAVFVHAHEQIDRLVEMRADDVAARRHCRVDLARALVTMAEASRQADGVVPTGAVAVTGADALERVRRLLHPPAALPTPVRLGIGVGLAALAVTPLGLIMLAGLFPTLSGCPPIG